MVQILLEIVAQIFFECVGPWRYLFSGQYRRKTHARWRAQALWLVGLQILGALLIYVIALAILAFIAWVAAVNIWPQNS